MAWSDKYIGIKYKYGSYDLSIGVDCRTLVNKILKDEWGYDAKLDDSVKKDFYKDNPDYMLKEGVRCGEIINDPTKLRERDVIFFLMDDKLCHMGIMIDNYFTFLHQLSKYPSRLDKTTKAPWKQTLYCGIRVKELHG